MKQALIGISLDSGSYTTQRTLRALSSGIRNYDQVTFLVTNSLQTYNNVLKSAESGDDVASIDWTQRERIYLEERKAWLTKLRAKLDNWPPHQEWKILGSSEIADRIAFRIHRNVQILYSVDDAFRSDVDEQADAFAAKRNHGIEGIRCRLSVLYILEEIALNLRLRVVRSIEDEFYVGSTFQLFINVYDNKYAKTFYELAGKSTAHANESFRFFGWSEQIQQWHLDFESNPNSASFSKIVKFDQRRVV